MFRGFRSTRELFTLYGDVTIVDEGLQILTYARHLGSLSSDGSLTCHTYYDTGVTFIIFVKLTTSDELGAFTTCFNDLGVPTGD